MVENLPSKNFRPGTWLFPALEFSIFTFSSIVFDHLSTSATKTKYIFGISEKNATRTAFKILKNIMGKIFEIFGVILRNSGFSDPIFWILRNRSVYFFQNEWKKAETYFYRLLMSEKKVIGLKMDSRIRNEPNQVEFRGISSGKTVKLRF